MPKCPDFLFFHATGQNINVSIVDPHGHHFADALHKLRGLADFAATHRKSFHPYQIGRAPAQRHSTGPGYPIRAYEMPSRGQKDLETLYQSERASDYLSATHDTMCF